MIVGPHGFGFLAPSSATVLSWTPAQITTALWLDADDATTITLDVDGNVEQWDDKSGDGHAFAQSISSRRPGFVTDHLVINGNQWLTCDSLSLSQPMYFALVYKSDDIGGNNLSRRFVFDSVNGGRAIFCANENGYPGIWAGNWYRSDVNEFSENAIYAGFYNGSSSQIFINGDPDSTGDPGSNGYSGTTILGANDNNNKPASGEIREWIWLDREPTTDEREKIEGYLAHKWGLEGDLPGGHPYKNSPP